MARILISTPPLEGCLDALTGHELDQRAAGLGPAAAGLLCPPTVPVGADAIEAMGALRVIAVAGAGADGIDHEAAAAREIVVLTAGEALVETTADTAFGLIIWATPAAGRRRTDAAAGTLGRPPRLE